MKFVTINTAEGRIAILPHSVVEVRDAGGRQTGIRVQDFCAKDGPAMINLLSMDGFHDVVEAIESAWAASQTPGTSEDAEP